MGDDHRLKLDIHIFVSCSFLDEILNIFESVSRNLQSTLRVTRIFLAPELYTHYTDLSY